MEIALIAPVVVAFIIGLSAGFAQNLFPLSAYVYLAFGTWMVGAGANVLQGQYSFDQRFVSFIVAIDAVIIGWALGFKLDQYLMKKARLNIQKVRVTDTIEHYS